MRKWLHDHSAAILAAVLLGVFVVYLLVFLPVPIQSDQIIKDSIAGFHFRGQSTGLYTSKPEN